MNTQSIDISLYQKGDIALEDIYKKFKNCFMRYAGKVLSSEFYAEDVVHAGCIYRVISADKLFCI